MKVDFSIGQSISEGCSVINKNWLALLGTAIITYVVSSALYAIGAPNLDEMVAVMRGEMNPDRFIKILNAYNPYASVGFWLSVAFSYFMTAGIYKMILNGVDGKKVDFTAFKMPVGNYLNFIAAYIIVGVFIGIGCMLCLIPGIFLTVRLIFAPCYTLDKDMDCISAIKASWADTQGNWWQLFGALILISLFALVGYLFCCIGAVYTIPAACAAILVIYRVLSGNAEEEENVNEETITE